MYYGKRSLILTCIAAILAGSLLHFVYSWMPCAITALFSPINESLWEHVKIVLWPYLAAAVLLNRDRPGGLFSWLLTAPIICAAMLAMGYVYHICLGGDAFWVDIAIYVAVMALGFWLPTVFSQPFSTPRKVLSVLLTMLLLVMVAVFTLYPPDFILFADLSAAGAWYPLPC